MGKIIITKPSQQDALPNLGALNAQSACQHSTESIANHANPTLNPVQRRNDVCHLFLHLFTCVLYAGV